MTKNTQLLFVGAVVLVGLLGGWYLIKQRTNSVQNPITHEMMSMGEESSSKPVVQSHRSYTLLSDLAETYQPKVPALYTFSIIDDQGNTIRDFQTVHEKIMHVIVVRKDLAEFQHVHPDFNTQTGQFTLANLTFPSDGQYRIFADFTPTGTQMGPDGMPLEVTLNEDISVGNVATYKPQLLTETSTTQNFQGYEVQLTTNPTPITAQATTMVSFTIRKDGKPVTNLEKYLGALGHSVVLSEGDLEFIHAHTLNEYINKQSGTIDFHVVFPRNGKYKLFTQFQHHGQVITTSFVVTVETSSNSSNGDRIMPEIDHNMHMMR